MFLHLARFIPFFAVKRPKPMASKTQIPRSFFQHRYLNGQQLWWWYRNSLRAGFRAFSRHRYTWNPRYGEVAAIPRMLGSIPAPTSYLGQKKFRFLNLEHQFPNGIDWNYAGQGDQWRLHLNYFDFLNQPGMSGTVGFRLIDRFLDAFDKSTAEIPRVLARRLYNWVKFLAREQNSNARIESAMHAQLKMLQDQLEIHLSGHTLLEEAMALVLGAWYLRKKNALRQGEKWLRRELEKQIFPDGGHRERSPMYHQQVLFRLLDLINVIQNNPWEDTALLDDLKEKASHMLGWLMAITFSNGSIPLMGDCANGLAPASLSLKYYAGRLGILPMAVRLKESGFRRLEGAHYQLIVSAGPETESKVPYHGHCDLLSFVLFAHEYPCLTDTGTSTYEANERRQEERSTRSHNTVEIGGLEQSRMRGRFQVGRQATVRLLMDAEDRLEAEHDGFQSKGITHRREFIASPKQLRIVDSLKGRRRDQSGQAHFHFAPGAQPRLQGEQVVVGDVALRFHGQEAISLKPYHYSPEFNRRVESVKLVVTFKNQLQTVFDF